jgi:hypothetical protein
MRAALTVLALLCPFSAMAATFNIDADALKDSSGNLMTSGVIVLVADVKDVATTFGSFVRNGFSGPTAASFSGNDYLVHRWNFDSSAPEYFGPGAFQGAVTLDFSGQWQPGDPLRLYWFPQNTASDTVPGAGKPFGTYRRGAPETGSPGSFAWITPSNTATLSINGETASVPKESTVSLALLSTDANTLVPTGTGTTPSTAGIASSRMVVGRFVFYNGSAWDGNDGSANANDDNAIATDKVPLFDGSTATFANYTTYSRGINGIIVDIQNPANAPGISASDFTFNVGNDNTPGTWTAAPAPTSITRRATAGVNGSERYTIIWADLAIQKQWLQVTVLATANTGLSAADVFYFGNAIGESGNGNTSLLAPVNVSDEIAPRNNVNPLPTSPITSPYDYNRDKRINVSDEIVARNNVAVGPSALRLITP